MTILDILLIASAFKAVLCITWLLTDIYKSQQRKIEHLEAVIESLKKLSDARKERLDGITEVIQKK